MNLQEQMQTIQNTIKDCDEVIQRSNQCDECKLTHQHLKECLELTLEVLPILDKIPLDELKKIANL